MLCPGRGGGRCCDLVLGEEGGVVTWSWGRRCCVLVLGGGRCCDLVPGGGVVTWSWGGGRCCDLVLGEEVLCPGPGGR